METRKNTLKILFATGAKVPSYLEVLKFMSTGVKIPATDVHSVYKDENDQKFYIKFMDENSYNRFCNSVEDQYWFRFDDGSRSPVQLELASRQFKYIRLFNLPPETEEKEIAMALSKFGKIRQHVREKYPQDLGYHVFSGIRGVYMEVEKEIPANMYIAHFRARVYYDGLKNRCFFCKAEGHMKVECPKLASLRVNAETGGQRSYSSVTANLAIANSSTIEPDNTLTMTTLPLTSPPARPKMPMQPQEGDGASSAKTSTPANNPFVTLTPAEVPMETPVPRPEETTNNQASAATTTETPNKPVDATATVATPKETSAAEAERSGHDGMIIDGEQLMVDEAIKGTAEGEGKLELKKRPIETSLSLGSNDSDLGQGKGSNSKKKRGAQGQGKGKGKGRGK